MKIKKISKKLTFNRQTIANMDRLLAGSDRSFETSLVDPCNCNTSLAEPCNCYDTLVTCKPKLC